MCGALTLSRLFAPRPPARRAPLCPPANVEERIRLFRRVVSDRPPAIWEAFFAKTLARIAPLKPESDYLVLKLDADEELRRHLATDPILRELALKVEGLRIAVRRGDLKKLAKRLEQFGYLSAIG